MAEPEFYTLQRSGIRIAEKGTWKDGIISRGGWHTWEDWQLYWVDPVIGEPEVESYTVKIPGRHGVLDLSEVLTGFPVYHNRTISATFRWFGSMERWHLLYAELLNRLHGRVVQLILDTACGYYYEGRCRITSVREDAVYSTFTLTVDASPYQLEVNDTVSDWLWDPFCFETGVIREYGAMTIPESGTLTITIVGSAMLVLPVITVSQKCTASDGTDTYELLTGENTPFLLGDETKQITLTGTAGTKISIFYRGGML